MKDIIKKNADRKKVIILFVLTNIIYSIMLFITIPKVMQYTNGSKLLDMMPFGYNSEYVNSLLSIMGTKGRSVYLYQQIPLDMIYPLLFAITYSILFTYILRKLNKQESYWFPISYLPIFAGIFDYCENLGIITLLNTYPHNSVLISQITSICTILKSWITTIFFIALLISLVIFIVKISTQKINS
ncbi:hypothetical protein [Flavobacterium sp. H4147]|uniref:hypothetical protein n=1 Tax=Flavobacterium sp. H4147 TaxID=3034149 RepID=UPI0023EB3FB0|nr:hypothetical protein [Flavobacterium sp. H4147]